MSKRLMPTYLINFLSAGYQGDIPANFGERLVSRQAIAFTKKLYDIFVETSAPVNFGSRMLPEYLVKFLDELRSSDFIVFQDEDTAFIKDVPDITDISCKINAIGGMSYKSENLVLTQKQINLTAGSERWVNFGITNLTLGETYTLKNFTTAQSNEIWQNQSYSYANFTTTPSTFTATSSTLVFRVGANTLNDNINYESKIMLVKGSTAPTEWVQGFAGIRDSAVTSVVSKDASNNTVDTITIDASIQALEGYGQSNPDDPTEYNYIDLENKKYIEVGYIDNGVWTAKDDEIDISSYIDTNIIDIKENGTLTFTNTYDQAVPSSVDYYIPKEAYSNGN